jgi:hypothetical protein
MGISHVLRDALSRLAKNLELSDRRVLPHRLGEKRRFTNLDVCGVPRRCVGHVAQVLDVAGYRRTASFSTAGLYALVGVSALGWIEYRVIRHQWTTRGAEFRGRLGRRWLLSALMLFAVVMLLAALTPTDILLGVANTVWHVVGPLFAQPVIALFDHVNIHYTVIRGGVPGGVHHYGRGRIPKNRTAAHVHGGTGSSWTGIVLWMSVIVAVLYLGRALNPNRQRRRLSDLETHHARSRKVTQP